MLQTQIPLQTKKRLKRDLSVTGISKKSGFTRIEEKLYSRKMMRSADPSKLSLRERELSLREGRGTRERMFGNCLTGAADEERNLLMEAMASSACSSKQSPRDTDPVG